MHETNWVIPGQVTLLSSKKKARVRVISEKILPQKLQGVIQAIARSQALLQDTRVEKKINEALIKKPYF